MSDFNARLRALEKVVSPGAEGMDPGTRTQVVRAIRRHRSQRSVAVAAGSFAVVAILGGGGWLAFTHFDTAPVVAPSESARPSVSPSADPSPPTSPSPTPSSEPGDSLSLVDASTARELSSPSTGETWHERVALTDAVDPFNTSHDYYLPTTLYSVGEHGDATIAVAVTDEPQPYSSGYPVVGLFEIGPDGTLSLIACPSTRPTDACVDVRPEQLATGVVYDTSTHYASLTYPETVVSSAYGELRTAWLTDQWWGGPGASTAFGVFEGDQSPATQLIGTLGSSSLITTSVAPLLPEMSAVSFSITTPYGSAIRFPLSPPAVRAFEGITWNDGSPLADLDGNGRSQLVAPSVGCAPADVVTVPASAAGSWVAAGIAADGSQVLLPEPDNALAARIFEALRDTSAEGEYAFSTLDAFLAARSLVAIESAPGTLTLGVNSGAAAFVWDCL